MLVIEDAKRRRAFVFQNYIRLAVLAILLLISVFIAAFFHTYFPILPIIVLLITAIVFSELFFTVLVRLHYRLALYMQIMLDIVFITLLVYLSGGIESPFYFLYILPIIAGAAFLSRKGTLYITTISFIIFGSLANLIYLQIIPTYPGTEFPVIALGTFVYNLLLSFLAFSFISITASYYFERMKKTGEELRNIQDNLQDMISLNNSVLEKMDNGYIAAEISGKVVSYNERAVDLVNVKVNSHVFHILNLSDEITNLQGKIQTSGRVFIEKRINERELGITISQVEKISAYDRLYVILLTDLTEIRTIERRLKERENLALIGEMAAGIAHELRNPLAAISGSVQFLKREVPLAGDHQHLMEIVVKESARLSTSIDLFLNFAKNTPLTLSEFDLLPLVEDIIAMMQLHFHAVKFIKRCAAGCLILADGEKIRQLVWNLLNNAVKAVAEKGEIIISIYTEDSKIYLSIKDNGIGIDKNDLQRIFTPFFSRFSSGIGLGMAMVKRIVDEHQFEISILSEKKFGTEVIICFKKQQIS